MGQLTLELDRNKKMLNQKIKFMNLFSLKAILSFSEKKSISFNVRVNIYNRECSTSGQFKSIDFEFFEK